MILCGTFPSLFVRLSMVLNSTLQGKGVYSDACRPGGTRTRCVSWNQETYGCADQHFFL